LVRLEKLFFFHKIFTFFLSSPKLQSSETNKIFWTLNMEYRCSMLKTKFFLNFCTQIYSKHQYFNYSWEYDYKGLECTNANNNIESRFPNHGFFYQLWYHTNAMSSYGYPKPYQSVINYHVNK